MKKNLVILFSVVVFFYIFHLSRLLIESLVSIRSTTHISPPRDTGIDLSKLYIMQLDSGRQGLFVEVQRSAVIGDLLYKFFLYLKQDEEDGDLEISDYDNKNKIGYSITYLTRDSGFCLTFVRINDRLNVREKFIYGKQLDSLGVSYSLTGAKDYITKEISWIKSFGYCDRYVLEKLEMLYLEILEFKFREEEDPPPIVVLRYRCFNFRAFFQVSLTYALR